jgi:hypothetical protein
MEMGMDKIADCAFGPETTVWLDEGEAAARKYRAVRYDALIEAACTADEWDVDGGVARKIANAIRKLAEITNRTGA